MANGRERESDRDIARAVSNVRSQIVLLNPESVAEFHRGFSRAVASAFRAYEKEIDQDNIYNFGAANGVWQGLIAAYGDFYEELAQSSRRMLGTVKTEVARRERESRAHSAGRRDSRDVDYDRLGRSVASESRKGKARRKSRKGTKRRVAQTA